MKIFINTKFDTYQTRKENKHFVKISFTEVSGMFAVIGTVSKNKVSIQSFPETTGEHIYGLSSADNYEENEFYKQMLGSLHDDTKKTLLLAANELERSFRNHVQKRNIPTEVQVEVYGEIKAFCKRFQSALSGAAVVVEKTAEWKRIDDIVSSVNPDDLNKIIDALRNENKTVFNGREYRILEDGGRAIMQYREITSAAPEKPVESTPETPVVVQKQRRKIRLARMVDPSGLTEFVKGHFYNIRGADLDFVKIENENGQIRSINLNRVELVDVFSEPPINEENKEAVMA